MTAIRTRYGDVHNPRRVDRMADGTLVGFVPSGLVNLTTDYGVLTPQYSSDDLRRKDISPVELYPDGTLKSLSLQERTRIVTPVGAVRAEQVFFHPNGAVKRIFPLNGKISGYWTPEDESALAELSSVRTPLGEFTVKVLGFCFYEDGALRSLTLWPEETIRVPLPGDDGPTVLTRIGLSFWPEGWLRSLEPASPQNVPTPAGTMQAYDPDAVGINADANSLSLHEDGSVHLLATVTSQLVVTRPDGTALTFCPAIRESLCGDSEREVSPMKIEFTDGRLLVHEAATVPAQAPPVEIALDTHEVRVERFIVQFANPLGPQQCSG